MKIITRKKMRTVQEKTAEAFDREFNKVSGEITEDTELVWDAAPMCVHFVYEEHVKIAENARDELSLRGIKLKCKDCPHREKNPDGRKAGRKDFCPFAFMNQVRADDPACELFCSEVLRGETEVQEEE